MVTQGAAPTAPAARIQQLDVLRGVAILGILLMNIQSFAMPEAAYLNPAAYGDLTGLNGWAWRFSHLFGDLKFITLFSIMFGAGIVLMSQRADAGERPVTALHYRRMLGLLAIGLAHAYLLWFGDILVAYAMCGLVVFLFRRRAPRTLVVIGVLLIAVPSLFMLAGQSSMPSWPEEQVREMSAMWNPPAEKVQQQLATYRGGWLEQMGPRIETAIGYQTFFFLVAIGWRAAGFMLVGMALFKWGVLTGARSARFYLLLTAIGLVVGLPVIAAGIRFNAAHNWAMEFSFLLGSQFNYWAAPFVSLAYIGLVMLACRSPRFERFTHPFAAVGRTALSNYLLQSVLCTTIFYGHGLGLFGRVERSGQLAAVVAVWAVQLALSPIWLKHFRFGPVEWVWRSLTYLRVQPMRARRMDG